MKTLFLTLVTVLIYCSATCQTLQNDKIIGEWTVKNSQLIAEMGLDKEQSQQMESLRKGFIGSTFVFKADRIFQIKFPATANNFMKELAMLNNKKWKLNPKESSVAIGTDKDQYSLMGILVKNQGGKTYFILEESPFLLEVTKK